MNKKNKSNAQYEIRFDAQAWDSYKEMSNIKERKTYTQGVAKSQKAIEHLNRYDDFGALKIDADVYEKTKGSVYGIPRDDKLHVYGGRHVVFDHQLVAAQRFLSELRGFGLLADVVGSGKTFEAGIVLSELAARNLIKTMLIVVPSQVFDSWVNVLELKFGIGKGKLHQVRPVVKGEKVTMPSYNDVLSKVGYTKEITKSGEMIRPNQPILVDVDVFASWQITDNVVFDVIVVDEAHHLCQEDGEYAKAMQLLSKLMQNKKKFDAATYCLLLSATPHSGNLENMFRLWYFIRCQGGNPSDFEVKEDKNRTSSYRDEKNYYKEVMCHQATNVTDFIRRVKLEEVTTRFHKELNAWLAKKHPGVIFDKLETEYAKSSLIEDFLDDDQYEAIKLSVKDGVARAYHALLRSIMIRQPNKLSTLHKKQLQNILFYPVPKKVYSELTKLSIDGIAQDKITLDYTKATLDNNFLPGVERNGERLSMMKYIKDFKGSTNEKDQYAFIINKVLAAFNKAYVQQTKTEYSRKDYVNYYVERFESVDQEGWDQTTILPVPDDVDYKYNYLLTLLSKHKKERVIVFFDYEPSKNDTTIEDVVAALQANATYKDRLILSDEGTEAAVISKFNAKDDAILLVKTAALTEGANLQECNIVINYQVTPDPLVMDQSIGRVFRLGQKNDVTIYSLANMNQLEGYALAYFIGIGLMSSNSGDATILAGSNSDQMVTIRCEVCGNVKLKSRMEYEELLRKGSDELICHHDSTPFASQPQCEMKEISVSDYKCDKCDKTLTRPMGDEGYVCLSLNSEGVKGKMCNNGECGDRTIYCWKVCAMSHCKRLAEMNCLALKRYRDGQSESLISIACSECNKCTGSNVKCRVDHDVSGCRECTHADCRPKPYILQFNEKWEAKCPNCRDGKLRPVLPKTFAAYIRGLWKFPMTGDQVNLKIDSFCENLGKEANKVSEVRDVLKRDKEV